MIIGKLHFVSESRHHAKLAIERGIPCIQLRLKNKPYGRLPRQ
jgi:hypothetical protein